MIGLCLTFGTAGWAGLGGFFAILGLTAPAIARWGERTRPVLVGLISTESGAADAMAAQVAQVRAFNRFYTNVIGVLHGLYLDSPYTLTEGRLLFEIARRPAVQVSWLRRELDIDAGRAAVAELDRRAARQIGVLLRDVDRGRLLDAMRVITEELGQSGEKDAPEHESAEHKALEHETRARVVTLRPLGPGDLGWVLQRHGTVYAAEFGWDASFEALCARIIAEYTTRRDAAPDRTTGWIAEVAGRPAGTVCCVPDSETTARLRLLLVEPWARGLGIGARLVSECMRFAREAGYADITLWTYDRLAAARRIYTAAWFTLTSEEPDNDFGHQMMSQTWSRPL